ncbi:MAG: hypothetical protein ACR2IS_00735 [Nitrososphaeraceae archaeon]
MKPSSKFYPKSLTLLLPILKMVDSGKTSSEIAESLRINKSHVFYYLHKAQNMTYIKENGRDAFKRFEMTQAGKNFVAMYANPDIIDTRMCRAENIRFKAPITSMPSIPVDWHKVEMNNWNQYCNEINGIKLHINHGNNPTIEFIPPPLDGDNPENLRIKLLQDCMQIAQELEERLHMKFGRLELSSKGEWVVYDPIAKAFSRKIGQITVDGIGKVNASKPKRQGEFEFNDPRACADYMAMPRRVADIEQKQCSLQNRQDIMKNEIEELKNLLKGKEPNN